MTEPNANRRRVQRHRIGLREQGMRPLQIWVPDTRAPGFAEALARQCRVVARAATEEDLAFLDDVFDELVEDELGR